MTRGSLLCCLLVAFAACSKTKSDSMVVVTVTAPVTLSNVTQLRVTLSNAGTTDVEYFPETNNGVAIKFTNSFALSLPKSRQGDLGILVEGLDASSQVVASGTGTVGITMGGRADVTIDLAPVTGQPGAVDAGGTVPTGSGGATPDTSLAGNGGTGGRPDSGSTARFDALGSGGITGNDGPVVVGSGGVASTGGVPGSGGKTGSGGAPATGGVIGSGGIPGTGGRSGAGGTTTSTGGSTGGGSPKCSPTTATGTIATTGGLACPGGLCTVDTYAGYLYVFGDGTSTICAGPDALCATGNTGVADSAGKTWGAGVGFNLDEADPPPDVALTGTGMTYALSALPAQGMRAMVTVGSKDYCVRLTSSSGTVAWTDFNTACWDNSGTKLTGAPKTPHVGFEVTAGTAAGKFDFCVKSASFK